MKWAAIGAVVIGLVYLVYSGAAAVISSLSVEPGSTPVASAVPPEGTAAGPAPATAPKPGEPPRTAPPPGVAQRGNASQTGSSAGSPERPRALSRVAASDRALRRELNAGLTDSRSRLASCPDSAGEEISGVEDGERFVVRRPPALLLEVATRDGAVEILDVRENQGRASEAFLACARSVLRGRVVHAESAKAGDRMRIPFQLGALR